MRSMSVCALLRANPQMSFVLPLLNTNRGNELIMKLCMKRVMYRPVMRSMSVCALLRANPQMSFVLPLLNTNRGNELIIAFLYEGEPPFKSWFGARVSFHPYNPIRELVLVFW